MLLAQSLDQLLVSGLVAIFSQDAQDGLPLVQGLGSLMKTVMDQSGLEDFPKSGLQVHTTCSEVIGGCSNGSDCCGHGLIFTVGHGYS